MRGVQRILMSCAPVRLAIVNDYEIVVAGLAQMMADDPRVVVVELDNQREVVSEVDIILADTFAAVPGEGFDLEDLIAAGKGRVVLYTWTADRAAVARALALGVSGYLSKGLSTAELVDALASIRAGETVISPPAGGPDEQARGDWPGRAHGLSPREAEVLALVARGRTNREIADAMFLSVNTIKTYIRSAYAKIGVTRRPQAVRWAVENGFVPEVARKLLTTNPAARTGRDT